MSRGPDAGTLLAGALVASAQRAGCPVTVTASDMQRWASATFIGARHEVTLSADAAPSFDRWLGELPEAEFALRGHLVADLAVSHVVRDGDAVIVLLEALTVEER